MNQTMTMAAHDTAAMAEGIVHFYRMIAGARAPQRADRSAAGTMPTRAYRYCQAVTSATAFGWWVFPPVDLQVMWDGADLFWHCAALEDWQPLLPSAGFPDFDAAFDAHAPAALRGYAPPFLTALPEPGVLQLWTGLMARTAPDWSLLLRAPANLPLPGGIVPYEGIVETDRWFGPLFTNLRLTRTHVPVRLRADFPLLQVQALPRAIYGDALLNQAVALTELDGLAEAEWDAYRESIVVPNQNPDRPFGGYAVASRKRGAAGCPHRAQA
ncbi:MAG: hypothetical protein KGL12_13140 [Rhodospirillales bacterium]|nr:hypothetical protein [Rhodospirillales bacterium]